MTGMPCYNATPFDPKKLEESFENVAFVIAVYHNPQNLKEGGVGEIEIFAGPRCAPCEGPSADLCGTLQTVVEVTVLAWQENPRKCKGCVVNGKYYPCCPV